MEQLESIPKLRPCLEAVLATAIAARMPGSFPNLTDIVPGIPHHHERWDGEGYPGGLTGQDIPLHSRLIALADAYDAMTSSRPYRHALASDAAVAEMRRCAGAQWPLDLTDTFLASLDSTTRQSRKLNPASASLPQGGGK